MTHPSAERFKGIHGLFISSAVLAQVIDIARWGRERIKLLRQRPAARFFSVALHVSDLLVQLEVVGLQRLDFGTKVGDDLELVA